MLAPVTTKKVRTAGYKRTTTSALLFCLTLVSACQTQRPAVSLAEGPRSYEASDYDATLKKWTRETKLLSTEEMDNVLAVTSTFESWDFRWAFTERYARDYRLSEGKKASFLKRSLDESKKYHQFYVALYAQHYNWADLEEDEPTWIVRLVDSAGTETDPIKLDKIRKPSVRELSYFPYTNSFRTVYRVSFPRATEQGTATIASDAKWFALRFAGAQGQADVTWQIE